jgi:hypothetical protein
VTNYALMAPGIFWSRSPTGYHRVGGRHKGGPAVWAVAASFAKQHAERQHLVSSFNRTIFEERRIVNAVRMNAMVVLDEFPLAGGARLAGIGVWCSSGPPQRLARCRHRSQSGGSRGSNRFKKFRTPQDIPSACDRFRGRARQRAVRRPVDPHRAACTRRCPSHLDEVLTFWTSAGRRSDKRFCKLIIIASGSATRTLLRSPYRSPVHRPPESIGIVPGGPLNEP